MRLPASDTVRRQDTCQITYGRIDLGPHLQMSRCVEMVARMKLHRTKDAGIAVYARRAAHSADSAGPETSLTGAVARTIVVAAMVWTALAWVMIEADGRAAMDASEGATITALDRI